jgi:predicted phosphodiesterase
MRAYGGVLALNWLHLSDFHIRAGESYDRDVVLRALVASVGRYREEGRCPNVVFATGDIAFSGKAEEYARATVFFDELLVAAGLERRDLFVVAGNHDVDRGLGVGLARTLMSREEADAYFAPDAPRPHLTQKQAAFLGWYSEFFSGIRDCPSSTCGPVEVVDVAGVRVGVLPINSALFCHDDNDHAKLFVGRRSLEEAGDLAGDDVSLRVALIHHPLEWLSDVERANIRAKLTDSVDVVLRGHLHETDVEQVVSPHGRVLHLAAGATYQTRGWPNRALYVTVEGSSLRVFPIRYEDSPVEIWTADPSVFPQIEDHTGLFDFGKRSPGDDDHAKTDSQFATTPMRSSAGQARSSGPVVARATNESTPRDFFISHASMDKDAIARPLAEALLQRGHGVWFDEFELVLGDSLRRSIDRGLASSRFGLVILSPSFFAKEWPQRELDGLTSREIGETAKVILPVWHEVDREYVARFSPPLADKLAVASSVGVPAIVEEIERVLRRSGGSGNARLEGQSVASLESAQGARPPTSKGPKEMARLLRSRNGAARAEGVNVAIQLGPEAVPDLHELVGHSRRDVRNASALALGAIGDERSIPYLVAALHSDRKPDSKNFWDFRPSVDEAANALSAYSVEARQVVLRDLDRPILWDQFLLLVRGVESDAAFATAEDMRSRGLLLLKGFNERGMLELLVRIDESKAWPRVRRLIGGGSKVSALPNLLPLLSGEHQIEIVSEWLSSGDKSDKYDWHIIIGATIAIPAGVANLRPLLEALSDGMVAYPGDSDEDDDYREKVSARLCELDEA